MKKLVYLFLAFGLLPAALQGQYRMHSLADPIETYPYESDILAARPVRYFIGLGPGALLYQHNGEFMPDPEVCHCVFSEYDEVKFHYAGEFSVQFPKRGYALKLLLQYYDFSGKFQYNATFSSIIQGDNPDEDVAFEKTSNVDLAYFSMTPGFAWYIPRTQAFVLGGIDIGVPVTHTYDNHEKVLTPGLAYDSLGTKFEYTFLENSQIPDVPGVRVGLQFALGVDIKLSNRFYLMPQAGATLPLNPISSKHETWKVTSEYGLVILKYRL